MIALQGLDIRIYLFKNITHRDIKPHNFLIGRKDATIIYLINFGLAKKYKSSNWKIYQIYKFGIIFWFIGIFIFKCKCRL